MIALGADILGLRLGVLPATELELNTLGDLESRQAYRVALVAYYEQRADELSGDPRRRLERNPLRILDLRKRATSASTRRRHSSTPISPLMRSNSSTWCGPASAACIAYRLSPRGYVEQPLAHCR